jgi:hypothetical protein
MTWTAAKPEDYAGRVVGNGHCVIYVQQAAGAPHTSQWRRGDLVRQAVVAPGTAIATFDPDGRYGNHTDGRSHAAILITRQDGGLLVWDQWVGHPVATRVIRFKGGAGDAVNDGDRYHVIVVDTPGPAAA